MSQLRCLALDVDSPSLAEVHYLLETDQRVAKVRGTGDLHEAADIVRRESVDAVFVCLVHHTVDEARWLVQVANQKPKFVALARDTQHAMSAFDMGAVDYLIKPLTRDGLDRALTRLTDTTAEFQSIERISADRDGSTHFIDHRDVLWVEAKGDYTIIMTQTGTFSCRLSMTVLTDRLRPFGFQRVHRSWLVPLNRIESFAQTGACASITVAGEEIPVSRRLLRDLKDQLI